MRGVHCVNVFENGYDVFELLSGQVLSPCRLTTNACFLVSALAYILTISQGGTWLGEMQRGKPAKSRLTKGDVSAPPQTDQTTNA